MIADQKPSGDVTRIAVFFSGSDGTNWWIRNGDSAIVSSFRQSLLDRGVEIIQVKWVAPWEQAPLGSSYGLESLACRPATVVKWVRDNYSAPKLVVTGESGGASQAAYGITSYDLASIVNIVAFTSGPPTAAISKGCLLETGYAYTISKQRMIDGSYGYNSSQTGFPGPCELHDPLFDGLWAADSVDTGGVSYYYPSTIVNFIVGGLDDTGAVAQAADFFSVLTTNQQPNLTWQVIPAMGHGIKQSQEGMDALLAALTQ